MTYPGGSGFVPPTASCRNMTVVEPQAVALMSVAEEDLSNVARAHTHTYTHGIGKNVSVWEMASCQKGKLSRTSRQLSENPFGSFLASFFFPLQRAPQTYLQNERLHVSL